MMKGRKELERTMGIQKSIQALARRVLKAQLNLIVLWQNFNNHQGC